MRDENIPAFEEDEFRKRQIEEMMRIDRPRYFRDEPMQQECRDTLSREEARNTSRVVSIDPNFVPHSQNRQDDPLLLMGGKGLGAAPAPSQTLLAQQNEHSVFSLKLEPPGAKMAEKIASLDCDIANATRQSLQISSRVIDKFYNKFESKKIADRVLSELPDLLSNGDVYKNNSRIPGRRSIAMVRPHGQNGDKLIGILELNSSNSSAEFVSIHIMPKGTFANRMRDAGALAIGATAGVALDDDPE